MILFVRRYLVLQCALTLTVIAALPQSGQQEVLKKPFQQWSKVEVTKILNDSGWAKTQAVRVMPKRQLKTVAGQVNADAQSTTTADRQAALGGAEEPRDYRFTIRLRSALPIRQAIVRLVQLEANYDQIQPAQRKSLDEQTREILECKECRDNYIVSVGFGSTNSPGVNLVYDWFKGQTRESLKGYLYLGNDHGERRDLTAFISPKVPGDEAFFFFARYNEAGKPLITTREKKLLFRMSDVNVRSVSNFALDVDRMIVDGKVEF